MRQPSILQTAWRLLTENGYAYRKYRKVSMLSHAYRLRRLDFAAGHLKYLWSKVMWTDSKFFSLNTSCMQERGALCVVLGTALIAGHAERRGALSVCTCIWLSPCSGPHAWLLCRVAAPPIRHTSNLSPKRPARIILFRRVMTGRGLANAAGQAVAMHCVRGRSGVTKQRLHHQDRSAAFCGPSRAWHRSGQTGNLL